MIQEQIIIKNLENDLKLQDAVIKRKLVSSGQPSSKEYSVVLNPISISYLNVRFSTFTVLFDLLLIYLYNSIT